MNTTDWTAEQHIDWIRQRGAQAMYANEVWLNVQLSTWEHSMGFTESAHTLDLVTTTEKYRQMGVIQ